MFIGPGTEIYEGMVIGASAKESMAVNATKEKKMSNMRSAGADFLVRLNTPIDMTLDRALEYIDDDEYVEVTPKSVRIRKIWLKDFERKKYTNKA
jgi:GTP-binding protein